MAELTRDQFVRWGKKGGVKTKKKYGKGHYSAIGKKGGRPKLKAKV